MTSNTLAQVAEFTGGRLIGADAGYDGVSTDTRTLNSGELFIALRGERFDAQEFLQQAAERGAAGAMVEGEVAATVPLIVVPDARKALGEFSRRWRHQFQIPLIAITGSNGKTTAKEMIASIMRARYGDEAAVLATAGNFNNDIGMPLTLLKLRKTHRAAVIEMGASQSGDIELLGTIAVPDVAVITNAARAHLEGFGSLEMVVQTKGELLDCLTADGTAVLNMDDPNFAVWQQRVGADRVLSFGLNEAADYRATNIRPVARNGRPAFMFDLESPAGSTAIALPLAGKHNVLNALAAAAAAMAAGATLEHVQMGLASSRNVPGRMRVFRSETGAIIFDDSYNANPDSVAAAIASLREFKGEPWMVLGDMGELGPDAAALHRATGELARSAGIRGLFCVGELSRETAAGFGSGARWFASIDKLRSALDAELRPGLNVLVKGSRFMGLDQLVSTLEPVGRHADGEGAS